MKFLPSPKLLSPTDLDRRRGMMASSSLARFMLVLAPSASALCLEFHAPPSRVEISRSRPIHALAAVAPEPAMRSKEFLWFELAS